MKIEKASRGATTTIFLIGHFQSEHIEELKKQLLDIGPQVSWDLKEVTIVDLDVVRFLGASELEGAKLIHCPAYIREWTLREQQRGL